MIIVVARSEESGSKFVKRHSQFSDHIALKIGQRSYFGLLQDVIDNSELEHVCVVHDDVFLPRNFVDQLGLLVDELNDEWPNWGLVGNAGVCPFGIGYGSSTVVRYIFDPHGGPNTNAGVVPALGIDGNVMLLHVGALRRAGVRMPDFNGFQLYDICLSIETIIGGLAVLVSPRLACFHSSAGGQQDFDIAMSSAGLSRYLASRIANKFIPTLNGKVVIHGEAKYSDRGSVDLIRQSIHVASIGRPPRKVAIVVRTQFKRRELLLRTLQTIDAFVVSSGKGAKFSKYIVTDSSDNIDFSWPDTSIIRFSLAAAGDTRFKLVRLAAECIDAEYLWFVDDDDWLFPNEAGRLGLIINVSPRSAIFFIRTQQFREVAFPTGTPDVVAHYTSYPSRVFEPSDFFDSLSGHNHTPFCGAIFPRESILEIPKAAIHCVTYFEDYLCILWVLLSGKATPVVFDALLVGISIRESGNSITLTDRTEWNKSLGEIASLVCNLSGGPDLFSAYIKSGRQTVHQSGEIEAARAVLASVYASSSWRVTRPLRVVGRVAAAIRRRLLAGALKRH